MNREVLRSDIINKIISTYGILNPKYLEIGVWHGATFKDINTTIKDGVDPAQYCECLYVNYKMTSDNFFKNHINKKYDIIFIDGLHTAYQVTKDIYNSIANLSNGGWIILDDVFPHCEFEQQRLNLRKSGPQTGDVWKAVYHILDDIIEMSELIFFEPNTERGNFIFKLKPDNTKNIIIDESIPRCNVDGWYTGNDAEWNNYNYKRDFSNYITRLFNFDRINSVPNIFAIGDSHSIFYFKSKRIKHHWLGWGGMPVTMHTFIKDGIPLYNIVERLPPGDICKINIKDNDIVLFCFGWNDVQKNIFKYGKDNYKEMINNLVTEYINTIKKYSDGINYKIKPIINCVYPNSLSTCDTITGTDNDRIGYTILINNKLREESTKNNLPFFDIYDMLNDNGKLKSEFTEKDGTHLCLQNNELRQIIEDKLFQLMNKFYGKK